MKIVSTIIVGSAVTALLLAGCSGSPAEEPTGAPNTSADPTTSAPAPSVGNTDDPLCAAAQENIEKSAELQSKTGDLTEMLQDPSFLTSEDPAALNQWGEDMLVLIESTGSFYELGVSETAGDPVNADFVALGTFVDQYSTTLAQAAADATSPTDFITDVQELFTDSDITAAASAAPAAAQSVATYLGERCDITG